MEYLLDLTLRTLGVAAVAAAAIWLLRLKSAAARHAVWTLVLAGMFLVSLSGPLLPTLSLRVLRPATAPAPVFLLSSPDGGEAPAPHITPAAAPIGSKWAFTWQQAAAAVYGAGLLISLAMFFSSYRFTGRLVRASRAVDSEIYESSWISVPMTVGIFRPKILLPGGWREWPSEKLAAVMAHEGAHVRRGDWVITVVAGLNRSLFWFHPLAWWLERRLASLAEEACDDASLLALGKRAEYAQTLLDMAAAVKTGHGRMVWEAMAMAKTAEVRTRIERILDETRQIPRGLSRARWATLAACALPVIYLAAALQLAPAQDVHVTSQAMAQLQQDVAANPDNLDARSQLISYYGQAGMAQPRLEQIDWLIEHHPESDVAATQSALIRNRNTSLNSTADYDRAAQLWRRQAAVRSTEAHVLGNAAQFFSQPGADPFEAERLLQQASSLEPQHPEWKEKLARLYASSIQATEGHLANDAPVNTAFAEHARTVLMASTDQSMRARPSFTATTTYDRASGTYPPPATITATATVPDSSYRPRLPMSEAISQTAAQRSSTTPTFLYKDSTAPVLLYKKEAPYTEEARVAKLQGTVVLAVTVGIDGQAHNVKVLKSLGLGLDEQAMAAVEQWKFKPSYQNGQPVETASQVEVNFRLLNGGEQAAAPAPGESGVYNMNRPPDPNAPDTPPAVIEKVEPAYSEEARKARYQGTVILYVMVGTDGMAGTVKVLRSLGLGLDEKAMEAVTQWKFQPAMKNGQPVQAATTVAMNFRLLP